MPQWAPKAIWKGQDVFVIGGGTSLETFEWELLRPELTVGCNDAFRLGVDICKICVFGDVKWFRAYKDELAAYKGTVFTNAPQLLRTKIPWVWTLERQARGLHTDSLGWNNNTGASAINLALLLGAQNVYLLGFDMHEGSNNKPNWHNERVEKHIPGLYKSKFLPQFGLVAADLKKKFSGCQVFNVNENSELRIFPQLSPDVFWAQRLDNRERHRNGKDNFSSSRSYNRSRCQYINNSVY